MVVFARPISFLMLYIAVTNLKHYSIHIYGLYLWLHLIVAQHESLQKFIVKQILTHAGLLAHSYCFFTIK